MSEIVWSGALRFLCCGSGYIHVFPSLRQSLQGLSPVPVLPSARHHRASGPKEHLHLTFRWRQLRQALATLSALGRGDNGDIKCFAARGADCQELGRAKALIQQLSICLRDRSQPCCYPISWLQARNSARAVGRSESQETEFRVSTSRKVMNNTPMI